MKLAQDKLLRDFPTFMTRLQDPPGLPNLHLAVISQDMGAGDGSIAGCDATGGKQGIFQYTARGTCTTTNLDPGATYIADIAGVRNYTGNAADVFKCIAALGETGCGFEQSVRVAPARARRGRAGGAGGEPGVPPTGRVPRHHHAHERGRLLRDPRRAAVRHGVQQQPSSRSSVHRATFAATSSGTTATGPIPRRFAPNNDVTTTVTYNSCSSNDSEGYLLSATDTANRIKALKADPSQIAVVAIQAPTTPYTVSWKNPSPPDTSCGAASCPWPVIAHSCTASDGSFGDPGVRTAQLVREFGAHGAGAAHLRGQLRVVAGSRRHADQQPALTAVHTGEGPAECDGRPRTAR